MKMCIFLGITINIGLWLPLLWTLMSWKSGNRAWKSMAEEISGSSQKLFLFLAIPVLRLWRYLPKTLRQYLYDEALYRESYDKLHPGIHYENKLKEKSLKRLATAYGTLLAVGALSLTFICLGGSRPIADGLLDRQDTGSSGEDLVVEAQIEDSDEKHSLDIHISARELDVQEREDLFERVQGYIEAQLPGENEDLNAVSKPLILVSQMPEEPVTIDWAISDYNLIHSDGSIGSLEEYELPADTTLTASIHYEDYTYVCQWEVSIVERDLNPEEEWEKQLREAVTQAELDSRNTSKMVLPMTIGNRQINWVLPGNSSGLLIPLILGTLGVSLLRNEDEKLKDALKDRKNQLSLAYPSFVQKMVLMLGAGMMPGRSIRQLVRDLENEKDQGYLYQELKYAVSQMQLGVPEVQVYMDLGMRTELSEYIHFSQLLVQYIKVGSKGMKEMMLREVYESEKRRRDHAKRLGETAGTKLLLPMMMLLGIVLALVMVPALTSM